MATPISYDQAKEVCPKYMDLAIIQEAFRDENCEVLLDRNGGEYYLKILYKMDDLGENTVGLYLSIYDHDISVFSAWARSASDISGHLGIIDNIDIHSSLSDAINKAKAVMNICPQCGKAIPFKEQKMFSFAGRCCPACLPAMKKLHEYPGWYN